jgi:hypothetical protein
MRRKRASAVLLHACPPEPFLERSAEKGLRVIQDRAGRKWHDDLDLALRIIVGGCDGVRRGQSQQKQAGENARSQLHLKSSANVPGNLFGFLAAIYTDI